MPYIIETIYQSGSSSLYPPPTASVPAKRSCAVATLEEARAIIEVKILEQWGYFDKPINDHLHDCRELPESGGTIGPLPDGTTIRVERVEWEHLIKTARIAVVGAWTPEAESGVLSLYNSAQAAR